MSTDDSTPRIDFGDQLGAEISREIQGMSDPGIVRRNCSFCGRERSRTDDNHAPECSYWTFFGGPR